MAVSFASIMRMQEYWPDVRPGQIPMDLDYFEALNRHPGWKYEYMEGAALVRPSHGTVGAARPVEPLSSERGLWTVDPVKTGDDMALRRLYEQVFAGHVDLFGASLAQVASYAAKDLRTFFSSTPSAASGLIRDGTGHKHLASTLLVVEGPSSQYLGRVPDEPELQLLMVQPAFQGRGVARALLAFAMERLHDEDVETLFSAYTLANDRGRRWYQKNGFAERPNRLALGALLRRARQLQRQAETEKGKEQRNEEVALLDRLQEGEQRAITETSRRSVKL